MVSLIHIFSTKYHEIMKACKDAIEVYFLQLTITVLLPGKYINSLFSYSGTDIDECSDVSHLMHCAPTLLGALPALATRATVAMALTAWMRELYC